ncbi:MAG: hypothetical protein NTW21_33735 [Verrucomicrobia bacterium]|nr:hypothetical protein [Verrucomicrobiota bacterium]
MKLIVLFIVLQVTSYFERACAEDFVGTKFFPLSVTSRPDFVVGLYVSESEGAQRGVLIALYIDSQRKGGTIAWGDGKTIVIGESETAFIRGLLSPVIGHLIPAEDPFAYDLGGNDYYFCVKGSDRNEFIHRQNLFSYKSLSARQLEESLSGRSKEPKKSEVPQRPAIEERLACVATYLLARIQFLNQGAERSFSLTPEQVVPTVQPPSPAAPAKSPAPSPAPPGRVH